MSICFFSHVACHVILYCFIHDIEGLYTVMRIPSNTNSRISDFRNGDRRPFAALELFQKNSYPGGGRKNILPQGGGFLLKKIQVSGG